MGVEPKYLLWLDLETTGSDEFKDDVLEVAMVVTDFNLAPLIVFSHVVRITPNGERQLEENEFVREMHENSDLLRAARVETASIANVDSMIDDALKVLTAKPHEFLLSGSGVSHFDRRFVRRHMPLLEKWLAYPHLDIGVLRRGLRYLGDESLVPPIEQSHGEGKAHRAMPDLRGHLLEAAAYKELFSRLLTDGR